MHTSPPSVLNVRWRLPCMRPGLRSSCSQGAASPEGDSDGRWRFGCGVGSHVRRRACPIIDECLTAAVLHEQDGRHLWWMRGTVVTALPSPLAGGSTAQSSAFSARAAQGIADGAAPFVSTSGWTHATPLRTRGRLRREQRPTSHSEAALPPRRPTKHDFNNSGRKRGLGQ